MTDLDAEIRRAVWRLAESAPLPPSFEEVVGGRYPKGRLKGPRRRRRMAGVIAATLLLAAGAAGLVAVTRGSPAGTTSQGQQIVAGAGSQGESHTSAGGTPVPISLTPVRVPRGWIPVDFQQARFYVPGAWTVTPPGEPWSCGPQRGGWIVLEPPPGASSLQCYAISGSRTMVTVTSRLKAGPLVSHMRINGFQVLSEGAPTGSAAYYIPVLQIGVTLSGPQATEVLHTLSWSAHAVATARGREVSVSAPSSWKVVSYGRLHARVPRSWPVQSPTGSLGCSFDVFPSTKVYLGTPAPVVCSMPSNTFNTMPWPHPVDGLLIEPDNVLRTLSIPISPSPDQRINNLGFLATGLSAFYLKVLVVEVPDMQVRAVVTVGLGPDPTVARRVLNSLWAG